jgi:putative ABC transport system permease protein
MLFINLRLALRNLRRNKTYTFINLIGLGLACSFVILVLLFVSHEVSIDKFHANGPRLYRMEMTDLFNTADTSKHPGLFTALTGSAEEKNMLSMPVALSIDLKKNFPEVKEVVRFTSTWQPVIRAGQESFKEDDEKVAFVDKNFFTVFSFPLSVGSPSDALPNNNSVVLSESAAQKYFGSQNPIGKTLALNSEPGKLFTVSAVAKDFPPTSSMHFDVMFPVEGSSDYQESLRGGSNRMSHFIVIELAKDADVRAFKSKLLAFGKNEFKSNVDYTQQSSGSNVPIDFRLTIRPFADAHFNKSEDWFHMTDLSGMLELITLTLVGILISCLNYILISMSRVAARSQETGVRKVIGATRTHVIAYCLTETFVLVLLSVLTGLLASAILLPYFNQLTGVSASFGELFHPGVLALLLGVTLLLTLAAGIYPALTMAGIKPISLLRTFSTYKLNPALSKVVVVVQYTACIILIFFAIVISRQMHFIYNKDLGFERAEVVLVENPFVFAANGRQKTSRLREELQDYAASQPAMTGMTGASFKYAGNNNSNGHIINGKREFLNEMTVDYNYFEFNKIPIINGRAFSPAFATDTARLKLTKEQHDTLSSTAGAYIVVNETLYNMLGKPALGSIDRSLGGIIIGVCRDYHFRGLQQQIGPVYHQCRPDRLHYFWLKIGKGQDVSSVIAHLKTKWASLTGNEPFTYSFMEEDIRKIYESDQRWMNIIGVASFSAILIACLGLFGLSAIISISRTKEIGIRKVLGAEIAALYLNLNKGTLVMIGVSIIIALPIARWIATNWLRGFAYRIGLGWGVYTLSILLAVACALLAVSYHTLRAAMANPINSLRTE